METPPGFIPVESLDMLPYEPVKLLYHHEPPSPYWEAVYILRLSLKEFRIFYFGSLYYTDPKSTWEAGIEEEEEVNNPESSFWKRLTKGEREATYYMKLPEERPITEEMYF